MGVTLHVSFSSTLGKKYLELISQNFRFENSDVSCLGSPKMEKPFESFQFEVMKSDQEIMLN